MRHRTERHQDAAEHLVTYYNAVQPQAQIFDEFFIGWRHISNSTPLVEGVELPAVVKRGQIWMFRSLS
jgi:hypothetical protein